MVVVVAAVSKEAEGDVGGAPAVSEIAVVKTVGAAVVESRRSVDMRLCDKLDEVEDVDDFLDRMIRLEEGFTCSTPVWFSSLRRRRSTR